MLKFETIFYVFSKESLTLPLKIQGFQRQICEPHNMKDIHCKLRHAYDEIQTL